MKNRIVWTILWLVATPYLAAQSKLQAMLDSSYRYWQNLLCEQPFILLVGCMLGCLVLSGFAWLLRMLWRGPCRDGKFDEPAWGIVELVFGIWLYLSVYLLVPGIIDWKNVPETTVYLVYLFNNTLFTSGFLGLLWLRHVANSYNLGCRPFTRQTFFAATLGYFLFLPWYLAAYILSQLVCGYFGMPPRAQKIAELLLAAQGLSWYLGLFTVVVAAPLFEEFIFRVFFYTMLRKMIGIPRAVIASALVFALIHWEPGNVFVVMPIFVLGIFLALLYEKTQSLWAAGLAHACHNGLTMAYLCWML
jgi:membrane protease YdiL (CAAX protease family)